jgi:hypothetical protein
MAVLQACIPGAESPVAGHIFSEIHHGRANALPAYYSARPSVEACGVTFSLVMRQQASFRRQMRQSDIFFSFSFFLREYETQRFPEDLITEVYHFW